MIMSHHSKHLARETCGLQPPERKGNSPIPPNYRRGTTTLLLRLIPFLLSHPLFHPQGQATDFWIQASRLPPAFMSKFFTQNKL